MVENLIICLPIHVVAFLLGAELDGQPEECFGRNLGEPAIFGTNTSVVRNQTVNGGKMYACQGHLSLRFKLRVAMATGVLLIVQSSMVRRRPEREPGTSQQTEEASFGRMVETLGEILVEYSTMRTGEMVPLTSI